MDPGAFVDGAAQRLQANGAAISRQTLPGGPVLIGYQSRFRLRWMATRLHLFTVVATGAIADAASLERLTNDSLDYSSRAKGKLRGFQTGVAAIAVLAAESVDATAVEFAENRLIRRFAAFAWPAVVDLGSGRSYFHMGRVAIGAVYASYLRRQTAIALGLDQQARGA